MVNFLEKGINVADICIISFRQMGVSKLFSEFFLKVNFEKKMQTTFNSMQNFPACKELGLKPAHFKSI